MNAVLKANGSLGNDVGRMGHGLGMQVTEWPSHTATDETVIQENMVLTLEPGLYVRPSVDVPEAFWNIGIRIEDDAIVTATGCELISRDVPVEVDAIEALMAK